MKRLLMILILLMMGEVTYANSRVGVIYGLSTTGGDGFLAVRSGPSTRYEKLGELYNGNSVEILAQSGRWYRVHNSRYNLSGWVYGRYVNIDSNEYSGSWKKKVWPKIYKTIKHRDHMLGEIVLTNDGGFMVTGVILPRGASVQSMYIAKFRSDGSLSWIKTYDSSEVVAGIVPTRDGNFVALGANYSSNYLDLIKIDKNGKTIWQKKYDGNYMPRKIIPATDGGFVVLSILPGSHSLTVVTKVAKNGKMIWQKKYTKYGYNASGESYAIMTTKGGYIVFSTKYDTNLPVMKLIQEAFKIDKEGNVVWKKRYSGNMFGNTSRYMDFKFSPTKDGGCVAVSVDFEDGDSLAVVKLNKDYNVVWRKRVKINSNGLLVTSVIQSRDGGYLIVGRITLDKNSDALILKIDQNGNMLWYKTYGESLDETAFDIIPTGDGGYMVAANGDGNSESSYYLYLVKIDENGNIYQ